MLIGELAAEAGTTTRALRYYEQQGLLTAERDAAGYRRYAPDAVERVRNVRRLLGLGFTIADIRLFAGFLDLPVPDRFGPGERCAQAYAAVLTRFAALETAIAELSALRDGLAERLVPEVTRWSG